MLFKKLLKDVMTEGDNATYCPVRVFAAALSVPSIVFFIAGCVQHLYRGDLSLQDLATSFTTMAGGFAAFGAGVAVKAFSDRKGTEAQGSQSD